MTKFDKTQIHFKSDVLAAVAVVDDKAPYFSKERVPETRELYAHNAS